MNAVLSILSAEVLISSPIRSSGMVFTPSFVSTVPFVPKQFFPFFVVVSLVVVAVVGPLVVSVELKYN